MEDEHQSTLKKKIQILFQLGKWPDVVKLCISYGEQYGKDMEIDMIRFKCERHMGIATGSPAPAPASEAEKAAPEKEEPPMALAADDVIADSTAIPAAEPALAGESFAGLEDMPDSAPPAQKEIYIGDPFADDELVITDPFAEDGPGFSLAPDQPPVDISGISAKNEVSAGGGPAMEMEKPAEFSSEPDANMKEPDFAAFGAMTIDAEPELIPSRPHPEPAKTVFQAREEKPLEDLSRSTSGRVDLIEEPEREKPAAAVHPEPDEVPRRPTMQFPDLGEKKSALKKVLTLKVVLLIVLPLLAAVVLWLALSGKLNFSGAKEPAASTEPAVTTPVARRPHPAKKAIPPVETPKVDEQEKAFAEKFQQAEELYKKGDTLKAWAVLLEAKKIKVTEPLNQLEEQLSKEIRTAQEQAKRETQVVVSQWQIENDAFARAETENTVNAWKDFLKKYPEGELAMRAERKIVLLEKQALANAQQQFQLKIEQAQKIRLRSSYASMNQADITAMVRQGGRPAAQFETHEHGGALVLIDYSSGLMWNLWGKPMAYDKAKWWANRITAGYGGWRLPTTEEALSLLKMDRGQYSGLADFAVWTGDQVSDQPRSMWILKIPEGRFLVTSYDQSYYVWAVRKAGK